MILAKRILITLKNNKAKSFSNVTQMYTVGNFLTITGDDNPGQTLTERFIINELHTMFVEF